MSHQLARRFINLSVGQKLKLGFGALVALAGALGLLELRYMAVINARVESMYTQEVVILEALDDAKSATYRIRGDALEHVLAETNKTMRQLEAEIAEQEQRVYDRIKQYQQTRLSPQEQTLLASFEQHFAVYMRRVNTDIIPRSASGNKLAASELARGAAVTEFRKAREAMNDLIDYNLDRARSRYQEAIASYRSTLVTVTLFILALVSLGAIFSLWLTRSITRPLHRIIGYFEQIAQGHLDNLIVVDRQDEIGKVLASLADTQAKLATSIARREQAEQHIKASLAEKELLLREVHHRVKNNLQVISSMLNLTSARVSDPYMQELFRDSRNRIKTIALIHSKLYQSSNLARIQFADYIRNLVANLLRSYETDTHTIQVALQVDDAIELSIDTAIPCGLIINELVSNSFAHAFPDSQAGRIEVIMTRRPSQGFLLQVKDNGRGLPAHIDCETTPSLGLQMVATLTHQLGGQLQIYRQGGTTIAITFEESTHLGRSSTTNSLSPAAVPS